jgi:dimethylargininase
MTVFRKAILRTPSQTLAEGITTADLGKPVYKLALSQHEKYIDILKGLGLEIRLLPADDRYPDSVFIEDVALCTREFAVLTSPGAESRKGEIVGMSAILGEYFEKVYAIKHPGTLEAGDVMMVGDHYFIGISGRTNHEGANQLISILQRHGFTGSTIELKGLLHLKSGVSYLENGLILVCSELADHPQLAKFKQIIVPPEENYAANSLWINNTVLVPEGFPSTRAMLEQAGLKTIVPDMSEFRKVDGGLSCISLRF